MVPAMTSLYIHVPFCVKKCGYCDFYSIPYDETLAQRYVHALKRELEANKVRLQGLHTVYVGGGTPSVLSEKLFEGLLRAVREYSWGKGGRLECTLEVNPATINAKKIDLIQNSGINRVSLGIQSFSDEMLALLGRAHSAQEADDALSIIKERFDNYSVDLIYGIPGQSVNQWDDTIDRVIAMDPPHISAYELTPEKGTFLFDDLGKGTMTMPSEETVLQMYGTSIKRLRENGYVHYEISSYAKPGHASMHNMNYWRRGDYIGMGPSAHSFYEGKRMHNYSDINSYCDLLEEGLSPVEEKIAISGPEAAKETIFLGLRTKEGIDLDVIKELTVREKKRIIKELMPYREKGLVEIRGSTLCLTETGFPLSNVLIVKVLKAFGL